MFESGVRIVDGNVMTASEKKRVLLITKGLPATDRRAWSGIPFSIKRQLEKEFTVVDYCINRRASWIALAKTFFYRKCLKSFVSIQLLKSFAKNESKAVDKIIKKTKCDCVLTTDVSSAGAVAYSKSEVPIIFFSDCIVEDMIDYYWFNVCGSIAHEMNDVLKMAFEKCSTIVLTSNWAKNGAVKTYGIPEGKIRVFPMGANLEVDGIHQEKHDTISLLFVGVDWERKGADIAIECVRKLNEMDCNHQYILHLVGCNPPEEICDTYVKVYGFLNRNNPQERELLEKLRRNADFFILPTKAECAGIVFCEASAYGIPSITYDTGGIGDYIINDFNGYRLPLGSDGAAFARKIIEYVNDNDKVSQMKVNARNLYEKELNWNSTGEKLRRLINESSR